MILIINLLITIVKTLCKYRNKILSERNFVTLFREKTTFFYENPPFYVKCNTKRGYKKKKMSHSHLKFGKWHLS